MVNVEEESASRLKRTLSGAEEEGGDDNMEWVRKKILKNVQDEGNAKITASRAIQDQIKQNMATRLLILILILILKTEQLYPKSKS